MFLKYVKGMEELGELVPNDDLPRERMPFPQNPVEKYIINDYLTRQQWIFVNGNWYVVNEEDMYEENF